MSVIGVDPGLGGALAHYNREQNILRVTSMPSWYMAVGKKTRKRIDAVALINYFELQKLMGAELVVIEAVGGRPKQSASSGFVFGYTVGLVYMACIAVRLPIETVPPTTWKKFLRVPGKNIDPSAIIKRADELLPDHREQWRGPKGGLSLDRAEAAMLALFGEQYVINSIRPAKMHDSEFKLVYEVSNVDVGA